ncbi:ArnT family glycosyltransferase [Desulfosporosinus lacus]|uniref:Dolichyl-phosphate-mannose-protein mannosyltransferase n=1 Tax=Desulfosporosinus lacus DSM 15449 TaxID=1121420 RepID=A0A1M5RVJ6_9FIRM|nr:glycosyltransferase family 39 protein [Desulfosporosinus lacus]SHH30199.1 Dolichyl-phosphate-mannose-protein mannosyltransferase [Desulfosporosinus lacus DSM 15449]
MTREYGINQEFESRASNFVLRKKLWFTGLLFLIALTVEVLYFRAYGAGYFISPDGLHYSNIAENFLHGNGLVNTANFVQGDDGVIREVAQTREYVVGPVYPMLLAVIYGIFGMMNFKMVILVLHSLLGAASAVFAYKTGELLFGKGYAWIPYCLTLGYPLFAFWGMYVLTEATYVFTITLFLYLLARYAKEVDRPKLKTLLFLGAAMGVSNLVRPLLLLYFPVLGIWIWWAKGWNLKMALRDFAVILVMTVVVMSPWWIRNGIKYHQFIAVSNYGSYEFYLGNNPLTITDQYFYFAQPSYDPQVKARIEKLPIPEQEKEYKQLAVSYIIQHPVLFLQRTFAKEKDLFWQPVPTLGGAYKIKGVLLDKWYLLLGLVGALLSLFSLKKYSFLLLFIAYYSFIVSMITVVDGARYRLPVMPGMILLGSLVLVIAIKGIGKLSGGNRRTGRRV